MGLFWKYPEASQQSVRCTVFADGSMVPQGMQLPTRFEVQEQGFVKVLAGVFLTLSLALAAALAVWEIREGNIGVSGLLLGGMFLLGALWLMADAYVRRIHVDGERICYTSSLGRKRTFTAAEIGSVKLTADIHKPYDREERLLLRWESNMKNAPYFIWFLTDHNVSIRR